MKNLKDLITESKPGIKCNIFIMNCGAMNDIERQNEVQELVESLNAKTYGFDDKRVYKINNVYKTDWHGPHFEDTSVVTKYIYENFLGENNLVFIP